MKTTMTRRTFLQKSSLVVAAAAVHGEFGLFNVSPASANTLESFKPHAFVEISQDDTITVWLGQTNLGQGTHTGISMIIADELDADWNKIEAKMALAGEAFKNPHWHMQVTGGSTSIRHRWDMIRKAGAGARQVLIQAAADEWKVDLSRCRTKAGRVYHPDGRSLRYGQLVTKASLLEVPENPPLKDPKEYNIIGTSKARMDIPDKVAGKTKFGIDFSIPNMCIATVVRPPHYGARPESYDEKAAMSVKGVVRVIELEHRIAVCAENTYAALKGREKLNIKWSKGSLADLNNDYVDNFFEQKLKEAGAVAEDKGDVNKAFAEAEHVIEAEYKLPFISHAQLEPINCTAHVEPNRCRIWVPTQGQTVAQNVAASITGLPPEKVEVMTTVTGGGFGLRSNPDPVIDAVLLSKAMGRPVKVMWTREDDFANGYFRPGSLSKVKAALDKNGELTAWFHKVASPSIMSRLMPDHVKNGLDAWAVQGINDMVYDLPNRYVEYALVDLAIPVTVWRSVGYSYTIFSIETLIDELAQKVGKDPLDFRLGLMDKGSRAYSTLSLLKEKSGWEGEVTGNRAKGVAVVSCFGSSAAHMAEVSVNEETGRVKVHKIVCAIDCGPAVYPDAITAQMEGAVVMALSVAFNEKIRFSGGGVQTANYDEYPLLTMADVPEIEVHIAKSNHAIGGVGEPGIPSVAPAVANAIARLTGVRLRELPFNTNMLIST